MNKQAKRLACLVGNAQHKQALGVTALAVQTRHCSRQLCLPRPWQSAEHAAGLSEGLSDQALKRLATVCGQLYNLPGAASSENQQQDAPGRPASASCPDPWLKGVQGEALVIANEWR